MDIPAWLTVGIGVVGCLGTTGMMIAKVSSGVAGIKTFVGDEIRTLKREFDEENDKLRHELAETLKPIQTHIALYEEKHYRLELYIRDNYIEVDTFRNALDEIKEAIRDVAIKVEKMSDANTSWHKEVRSKS